MNETGLEKRLPASIKEKGLYGAAFGGIALLLYVAGFPLFFLFFLGVITFFIWKVFSSEGRHETRRIFEFYLSANEILRDDERRWYGFEIQEAILSGERILREMGSAPPLVQFALGALYQKAGDHGSAVKRLSAVVEHTALGEPAIIFPTDDLREYVRLLRKIERSPAEAPLTSAAVRSLERARKNHGEKLLAISRAELEKPVGEIRAGPRAISIVDDSVLQESETGSVAGYDKGGEPPIPSARTTYLHAIAEPKSGMGRRKPVKDDRKTISEVLRDIYDGNV